MDSAEKLNGISKCGVVTASAPTAKTAKRTRWREEIQDGSYRAESTEFSCVRRNSNVCQ